MIVAFTGDGKGKTSAAIGTLIRAHGAGKTCAVVFFDKNPNYCNELKVLQNLGIKTHIFGSNRMFDNNFRLENNENDNQEAKKALEKAIELKDTADVLVLDELLNILRTKQIEAEKILNFLDSFPKNKFLIITGRGLPQEIEDRADLISEIKKIKHPIDKGIMAQSGIDY